MNTSVGRCVCGKCCDTVDTGRTDWFCGTGAAVGTAGTVVPMGCG